MSAKHLLNLVRDAEACRRHQFIIIPSNDEINSNNLSNLAVEEVDRPIIVHCSAGLGRTGCFIAICIGCEELKHKNTVDVLKIVSQMRLDRGGMVQGNEQYEFIHHALAAFKDVFELADNQNN